MPIMDKNKYSEQDGEYALRFLTFNSQLRRADLMAPGKIDGIVRHTTKVLMWMAVSEEGEQDWVARSLHAGDMPPTSTSVRDWYETTATAASTFVDAAIGNGSAIADDTFIGIYGGQFHMMEDRGSIGSVIGRTIARRPPVTYLRFVVGGTRVGEWDLFSIFKSAGEGMSSSSTPEWAAAIDYPVGIAESPIFISQNKTLLLQYYEMTTAATNFIFQPLGIVVQKRGAGDGLSP